jgi:hypothetical protein
MTTSASVYELLPEFGSWTGIFVYSFIFYITAMMVSMLLAPLLAPAVADEYKQ